MPKKKIIDRLLITAAWLLIISLIRWHWEWELIGFWVGGIVGTFFLEIDHLFYVFAAYPEEPTSQKVKALVDQNQYRNALILLYQTHQERVKLTFHSALFQIIFWILCFFVLTSTASLFGVGLVMAAALQLLKRQTEMLIKGQDKELHRQLWWQFQAEISLRQQRAFVIVMLLFFFGLNLFLI